MNWKRIAQLAVLIKDNYDEDHGTLKAKDGDYIFDMRTYISEESIYDRCGASCCAFGYAWLMWPDGRENKKTQMINCYDRYKMFGLNIDSDEDFYISNDIYNRLFRIVYKDDPNAYMNRTYCLLVDYGIIEPSDRGELAVRKYAMS